MIAGPALGVAPVAAVVPALDVLPAALTFFHEAEPIPGRAPTSLLAPGGVGAEPSAAPPGPASLFGNPPGFDTPAYYFLPTREPASRSGQPEAGSLLAGLRGDFPALHQKVNGKPLVWLDNAATTHKPQAVIDAVSGFYEHDNSNVHRGAHALARRATEAYEQARAKVAAFIGAASPQEVVFVRGATEGINLVAQTYGRSFVGPGDDVIVSTLEHHSNVVPWQMLCEEKQADLNIIPISDDGELLLDQYARLLSARTRLVAITAVSNVIGVVTPLRQVVDMAHAVGAKVLVDGAQAVQHMSVDLKALDADFFVFSGHKLFGPTGIGALYGKGELLERMPPWQGGGSMIDRVTFEKTTYAAVPTKFEAGTGHLAGAVGLGAAVDYVTSVGLESIAAHERDLMTRATARLAEVPGLRQLAPGPGRVSTLPFVIEGVPSERVGAFLDRQGIAVRAGHHCAQPLLRRLGLEAAVRASIALYNSVDDIDCLVAALRLGGEKAWE
jgi:cysteine desulfurase/selenocysteine lyase